jgi:MoxR-like ATPase
MSKASVRRGTLGFSRRKAKPLETEYSLSLSGDNGQLILGKDVVWESPEMVMQLLFGKKIDSFLETYLSTRKAKDRINGAIKNYIDEWKARYPEDEDIVADLERGRSTRRHRQTKQVMSALKHSNVLMVGPPGTGKTTIARTIATAWRREFFYTGPVQSEYKLMGFKDARGEYQPTAFYRAYKDGGLFLFDEIDACSAQALVAFNTALDNGIADFPSEEKLTKKSAKFICLAAANTDGRGNLQSYHGREPLDATTLDRFTFIRIGYDEELELDQSVDKDWTRKVQGLRIAASQEEPDHFISMRASIIGGKLLRTGSFLEGEVEDMVVWRGLAAEKVEKIKARMRKNSTIK